MTEHLRAKVGPGIAVEDLPDLQCLGVVDDFYASFEWSDGGLVHVHIALWIVGSPRIDKVQVPKELQAEGESGRVEINVPIDGETVMPQEEAASLMAAFWERAYTECNLAKAVRGARDGIDAETEDKIFTALAQETGPRIKLGRKVERERPSPESLSYMTMRHCLLDGLAEITPEEEERCWLELDHTLTACSRELSKNLLPGSASDPVQKRAIARTAFVACLAEWVNMHDLHKPFPLGPPSRDQPCCAVENEHATDEKRSCNKLFPRKCIAPGTEEIAEDPRRRDLFRLWLARNCHFMNNYVPIVLMSMLSNMDFQATLTKDAVIEYMTKYMTKAGQGSLVHVMEHSFTACLEKARESQQGSGSAILRWFNLQSITEVKSQLETMHLLFGVPRFLCSREFKDLWLRSEIQMAKTPQQIREGASTREPIACKSGAEIYINRHIWELPSRQALLQPHPGTRTPWWQEILTTVFIHSESARLCQRSVDTSGDDIARAWPMYLRLMSWWQLKRFYRRGGNSLACRPRADVVVVHPVGRFTTAKTPAQWRDASYWTLLAYCNHGQECRTTFTDAEQLNSLSSEGLEQLAENFILAPNEERRAMGMTACPPHVRKNWLLGCARRDRAEARKHSVATVTEALWKTPLFVFEAEKEEDTWRLRSTKDMTPEELVAARSAWKEADEQEFAVDPEHEEGPAQFDTTQHLEPTDDGTTSAVDHGTAPPGDRLCHCATDRTTTLLATAVRHKMDQHMRSRFKWTHRELHDALSIAGLSVPAKPSLLNYFRALHAQFGDAEVGFLPQAAHTHTKVKIQDMLKCFSRTGMKLGGKLADKKNVLAQRLAFWLNEVVEAGRDARTQDPDTGSAMSDSNDDAEPCARKKHQRRTLLPQTCPIGEVPPDAVVTPEQAESALGHVQATEFDDDALEALDQELRQEEEAWPGIKGSSGSPWGGCWKVAGRLLGGCWEAAGKLLGG
jgi:hypothetical protein